jgi:hypothetical protein
MASKRPAPKHSDDSANLVFDKVAENLYRHKSSKKYYALLKRGGKQFRRSLKTRNRHLVNSRLAKLRRDVANLSLSQDSKAGFDDIAAISDDETQGGFHPVVKSRVFLVDDHAMFREGMRQLIDREPAWF